jgi:hypothetical protein
MCLSTQVLWPLGLETQPCSTSASTQHWNFVLQGNRVSQGWRAGFHLEKKPPKAEFASTELATKNAEMWVDHRICDTSRLGFACNASVCACWGGSRLISIDTDCPSAQTMLLFKGNSHCIPFCQYLASTNLTAAFGFGRLHSLLGSCPIIVCCSSCVCMSHDISSTHARSNLWTCSRTIRSKAR